MLLLHLLLLWGGVLLLCYSNDKNQFRFLYLLIPFTPYILSQSGTVWKDIGFSFGTFFICTTCIFYISRQKIAPLPIVLGLLLICFYIVGIKFQAKFIAPILVFLILSIYLKRSSVIKFMVCTIISLTIIYANILLTNHFSINTHSEQIRQLFDLTGISVRINNDDIFPKYIKQSPIYNFEQLKVNYTSQWVDTLIYGDNPIFKVTLDLEQLKELDSAFFKAIIQYPNQYLTHRIMNFTKAMLSGSFKDYAIVSDVKKAKELGIDCNDENKFKVYVTKYLKIFPSFLAKTIIFLY